jgi:hypothetical protein
VKDGTWFRDAEGRYVLFRGINLSQRSKLPPYLPIFPLSSRTLDLQEFRDELLARRTDLARLTGLGINFVRIPIMWKALEPMPEHDSDELPAAASYLTALRELIDELYTRDGLVVVLDFHQDIAHDYYGGDGFPDWALAVDEEHPLPEPIADLQDATWGLNYYSLPIPFLEPRFSAAVRYTLQSFWQDHLSNEYHSEVQRRVFHSDQPQTHFTKVVELVSAYFRDHPGVLGYDLFNEPHPVGFPKEYFERTILASFYGRLLGAIRSHDPNAFVFIEPRMDWTTFPASGPEFQGLTFTSSPESYLPQPFLDEPEQRVVFGFHFYDPGLITFGIFPFVVDSRRKGWPSTFEDMRKAATSRGLIPFLTEYGCSHSWTGATLLRPEIYRHNTARACLDQQLQQIEAQLLNSAYWVYDLYATATDFDNWNRENFSQLGPNRVPRDLDILARPYPMRSSARPSALWFDVGSKSGGVILEGSVVAAPTVIFVPQLHYPNGFEVWATSAEVAWDGERQLLYWYPNPGEPSNQVLIHPPEGFAQEKLPAAAQALLPKTIFKTRVKASVARGFATSGLD